MENPWLWLEANTHTHKIDCYKAHSKDMYFCVGLVTVVLVCVFVLSQYVEVGEGNLTSLSLEKVVTIAILFLRSWRISET